MSLPQIPAFIWAWPLADVFTAAEIERLLEGLDGAFQAVLHSRFGGGAEVFVLTGGTLGEPIVLRAARAGTTVSLHLQLASGTAPSGPASAPGIAVGVVRLGAPPNGGIEDVTVLTEIFLDHDPNEAADATSLSSGIILRRARDPLGAAGLLVVRSREAGAAHDDQDLQSQRAWRPQGRRHAASGMLGASGRSHRVSTPPGLNLPVAADLLHRIGGAIASLNRDFTSAAILIDPGL